MKRLMAAALRLTQQGLSVFPLRPGDKRPLPHFKNWEGRATRDPDRVYDWWLNAPYNIGVATGPSQLLVIDCDTSHGQIPPPQWSAARDGLDVLRQLAREADASLTRTMAVQTPSGGIHLYFQAPPEHQLGNSASRLGWHIDTRGIGGYVVGPGSVCSGRFYVVVDRAPIALLPAWITERLVPRQLSQPPAVLPERTTSHYLRATHSTKLPSSWVSSLGAGRSLKNTPGHCCAARADCTLALRVSQRTSWSGPQKAGLVLACDDRDRFDNMLDGAGG
jgi:Bifunctional DNA primase/polymerase, N-terminal